jgi:hydroxymethylpyrimidine pyrophosphatase-like HAD family hydrolase
VNNPTANKGVAAQLLARLHGVTLQETWVYGNDHNDEPLFLEEFGRRYAVGIVPDRLRRLATHHITPAQLLDHIN